MFVMQFIMEICFNLEQEYDFEICVESGLIIVYLWFECILLVKDGVFFFCMFDYKVVLFELKILEGVIESLVEYV